MITRSALDALSFHQLHPDEKTRYVSFHGAAGPGTALRDDLLRRAIATMQPGSTIIVAPDCREGAHQLVRAAFAHQPAYPALDFQRSAPPRAVDWTQELAISRTPTIARERAAERASEPERKRAESPPERPSVAPRMAPHRGSSLDRSSEPELPPELYARGAVHSLLYRCNRSSDPLRAFARAASKVAFLADDGERSHLHQVARVLNEHKLAVLARRQGDELFVGAHLHGAAEELQSFLLHVGARARVPAQKALSTPELVERIELNLVRGQWARAERDIDIVTQRLDPLGRRLQPLDSYPRAHGLDGFIFERLLTKVERYNAEVDGREQALDRGRLPEQLTTPGLKARLHLDLTAGDGRRARDDLQELARRPDIGESLPSLDAYPSFRCFRISDQRPEQRALEAAHDRCDMLAREQRGEPSLLTLPAQLVRRHAHEAMQSGDWTLARLAVNELARRPSIGAPLPELHHYPRAGQDLSSEERDAMRSRIGRCNARATEQNVSRELRGGNRHPSLGTKDPYTRAVAAEADIIRRFRARSSNGKGLER